ncbi:hypothetical protein PIIN_07679 [Serendipita indica DSM 11827]|uniref:Uncharacterized protein n=1 Tax=Serendipita indica (strain DSM 11827) TaxID=1109443 RepID=G4TQY1_SERID|nr:hypothetical protein PIIN_07679 [Serendipita indica DSM 11827]
MIQNRPFAYSEEFCETFNLIAQVSCRAYSDLGSTRSRLERLFNSWSRRPPHTQKAYSAYSAEVQLMARLGQLDTNYLRWIRNLPNHRMGLCDHGCIALQDDHHLLVECPEYQGMREETQMKMSKVTEELMNRQEVNVHARVGERKITFLPRDDSETRVLLAKGG